MRRSPLPAAVLLFTLLAACADGPAAPVREETVALRVSANVMGVPVAWFTITVTAADLPMPLVFNLPVWDGLAYGSVNVPPGASRTFTARAFETSGEITHEGSATVAVVRGNNPPLAITLLPRSGHVPISIAIGSVSVVLTPGTVVLQPGDTVRLTAVITDGHGQPIAGATPTWASTNPAFALVDGTGLVTAIAAGESQVVAVFGGAAGLSLVTVEEGLPFLLETVVTGQFHTCALTPEGAAYCWGRNDGGQLGDGTTDDRVLPVPVSGGHVFTALSAGYNFTCGLAGAGVAYCWGANHGGQLGDGSTTNRSTPVPVLGSLTLAAITAGGSYACGLTGTGAAWCWGYNAAGQLGDGTTEQRTTPVEVTGERLFTQLSAGAGHTCGLNAQDAAVYCWGNNSTGQLGDGNSGGSASTTAPVSIIGSITAQQVSAGYEHTCALATNGALYCWGENEGRLGDGTTAQRTSPVPVQGDLTFQQVTTGGYHTCAVTVAGSAYCWGGNSRGELGDGSNTNRLTPTAVAGALQLVQIAAVGYHTCGVTVSPSSRARCWGMNDRGALGNGTTTGSNLPQAVAKPLGW